MILDWQTATSLVFVALATVWMLRRLLATGQGDSGCGSCSGCSAESVSTEEKPKRVYQLTQSDR